jgi:hypothetical protein
MGFREPFRELCNAMGNLRIFFYVIGWYFLFDIVSTTSGNKYLMNRLE